MDKYFIRIIQRFLRRSVCCGLALWVASGLSRASAQVRVPSAGHGARGVLQRDRVGSALARPFAWGRHADFRQRVGRNAGGIPFGDYDRTVPVQSVSAVSFPALVVDTLRRPARATSRTELFAAKTAPAAAPGASTSSMIEVRRKRFRLMANQLELDRFLLDRIGVGVYDDGSIEGAARVFHSGGPAGAERGGAAIVRVRGFSAPLEDRLSEGAVELWSSEQRVWIARGGPTELKLFDSARDPTLAARIADSFDELTHIEVTLEDRPIR